MEAITQERRDAHKAHRLKHAADKNDGLTVRLLETTSAGPAGKFVILSTSRARDLVRAGKAEHAE